jgi:hypothetical protein
MRLMGLREHAHAVTLFAMYCNFVRIHKTLRTTLAMAAGVTSKLQDGRLGDYSDLAWRGPIRLVALLAHRRPT